MPVLSSPSISFFLFSLCLLESPLLRYFFIEYLFSKTCLTRFCMASLTEPSPSLADTITLQKREPVNLNQCRIHCFVDTLESSFWCWSLSFRQVLNSEITLFCIKLQEYNIAIERQTYIIISHRSHSAVRKNKLKAIFQNLQWVLLAIYNVVHTTKPRF